MEFDLDDGPTASPWEILALAACEPLRGRPGFHVAPQVPIQVLTGALSSYLDLRDDELLLAFVDPSNGSKPSGGCVLTTRRVCWPSRSEANAIPRGMGDRGRSTTYDTLSDPVGLSGDGGGLDLGAGRVIALPGLERPALGALAGVLTTLHRALATGDLAGSAPPGDVAVARAVMPAILRQDAAIRQGAGEVIGFHAATQAATPSILVTRALIVACVLVFGAMAVDGVSPFRPDAESLFGWGGNLGAALALDGQFWRTLTAVFLHGGLIHLGINMWCLSRIGPLVERLYGHVGFALLYLAAGLGGFLASAWMHPLVVSVGASGAIFGVIGGLGAFLLVHREAIPVSVLQPMRGGVLSFIAYNILFGAAIPGIDNAAHIGGLLTGFIAGLVLSRPWPVPFPHAGWPRQLVGGLLLAATLAGLGSVVAGRIRNDPEVIAAQRRLDEDAERARQETAQAELRMRRDRAAAESYNLLIGSLAPVIDGYAGIHDDLAALLPRLGDERWGNLIVRRDLDHLLTRAESNREGMSRITTEDLTLRSVRDRYAEAVAAQAEALISLRNALDEPDLRARNEELARYAGLLERSGEAIVEATRQRQAFLERHGLVVEAGADPGPPGE